MTHPLFETGDTIHGVFPHHFGTIASIHRWNSEGMMMYKIIDQHKENLGQPWLILSTDAQLYVPPVTSGEERAIAIWPDYSWCFEDEIHDMMTAGGKSDDYLVSGIEFDDEPTYEQLRMAVDGVAGEW